MTNFQTYDIMNTQDKKRKVKKVISMKNTTSFNIPTTRKEFLAQYNSNLGFALAVEALGYKVLFGTTVLTPNLEVMP